jgi:hypothetical protein
MEDSNFFTSSRRNRRSVVPSHNDHGDMLITVIAVLSFTLLVHRLH